MSLRDFDVESYPIASVVLDTEDIALANLFRRAILSEIETYQIDIAIFYENTSFVHDETIALMLGLVVIDNDEYIPPSEGDFKTRIDCQGPKEFTTKDIPDIPFKHVTPILYLDEGQRITCDVVVKKGTGAIHVKWRPVSKVILNKVEGGYKFTIKNIGMMNSEKIFQEGHRKIETATKRQSTNMFFQHTVPS